MKFNFCIYLFFFQLLIFSQSFSQTAETEPNGLVEDSGVITITANGSFTGSIDYNTDDTDNWLINAGSSGEITFTLDSFTGNSSNFNANVFSASGEYASDTFVTGFKSSPQTITLSGSLHYLIKVFAFDETSGNYQFTISGSATLPVELVFFNATLLNNTVNLEWKTATEVNNYGFEVEKKNYTNNEWENIGFVPGNGNSNSPKVYSFVDENPVGEINSYRLKQVDFDGKFEYSPIADVSTGLSNELVLDQNYPNPFNPSTKISYTIPKESNNGRTFVTLKIFDALGSEVATLVEGEKLAGRYETNFDGSKLSSGVYFYSVITNNFRETKKMILSK